MPRTRAKATVADWERGCMKASGRSQGKTRSSRPSSREAWHVRKAVNYTILERDGQFRVTTMPLLRMTVTPDCHVTESSPLWETSHLDFEDRKPLGLERGADGGLVDDEVGILRRDDFGRGRTVNRRE